MRIGIDYTSALCQRGGIGRHTRDMVGALAELDRQNRYLLIRTKDAPAPVDHRWPSNFSTSALPMSQRVAAIVWQRLRVPLPLDIFTGRMDIFHSPDFVLPPLRNAKTFMTVHDLSFLRHPECAEASLVAYLRRAVPRSIDHATMVLAASECTKRDLTELLNVPSERIEVIYAGVNEVFAPVADERILAKVREKYHIEKPFLLYVGTIEPRKNLARLLEAYAMVRAQSGIKHQLILAGAKGWLYHDIFDKVRKLDLDESVCFLGHVPDVDLPALLSMADLFIFPSIYEGFGLPPLEAMACGTPVVAGDTSSLTEVLGNAALLVKPTQVDLLADAIYRGLTDDELRRQMRNKGFEQMKKFSWADSARKLVALYQKVVAE